MYKLLLWDRLRLCWSFCVLPKYLWVIACNAGRVCLNIPFFFFTWRARHLGSEVRVRVRVRVLPFTTVDLSAMYAKQWNKKNNNNVRKMKSWQSTQRWGTCSVRVTKYPVTPLVKFTVIFGERYGEYGASSVPRSILRKEAKTGTSNLCYGYTCAAIRVSITCAV